MASLRLHPRQLAGIIIGSLEAFLEKKLFKEAERQ